MGLHLGDHMFYIGLDRKKKHETIFLYETTRQIALIFGMTHHLVDPIKFVQMMHLGQKLLRRGGHIFT